MTRTAWLLFLLALLPVSFLFLPAHVEGQESAPAAPPREASPPAFAQTAPPEVDLQRPAVPPASPPPITPELEKIEQVRAEMDKPQPATGATATPATRDFSLYRSAVRVFSALCLVLAIILLLTFWVRRHGKKSPLFSGTSLASVMGRVYLEPRVCLHFVQTGGKVLVIGVTPNSIALLSSFDAASFGSAQKSRPEGASVDAPAFMAQLEASIQEMQKRPVESGAADEEVAALRKDIERLQEYLKEGTHLPKEA